MTKGIGKFLVLGIFAAILVVSFASAGWFGDIFGKMTGNVIAQCPQYAPAVGWCSDGTVVAGPVDSTTGCPGAPQCVRSNCVSVTTTMKTAHDYCGTSDVTVVNGTLIREWHTGGIYCTSSSPGYCKCYGSAYVTAPSGYAYNSSTMGARCSVTANTTNNVTLQCRLDGKALYSVNNTWCKTDGPCTPSCNGKQCGDDGCGGSCGLCSSMETCNSTGQCVRACTSKTCEQLGKQCGVWTSGCMGSMNCGDCEDGLRCNSIGQCVNLSSPECVNVTTKMSTSRDECSDANIGVENGTLIARSAKHELYCAYGGAGTCQSYAYKCHASAYQNYSGYVVNQVISDRGCVTNVANSSFRCRLDNGAKSVTLEWCSLFNVGCTESDGGKKYGVKGTACIGDECQEDYCDGDTILIEFYLEEERDVSETSCDSITEILVEEFECPDGCSDGVCVGCVPEWDCAVSPSTCPQSGIQIKKCVDNNECVEDTLENVTCTPGECSGCVNPELGNCVPFGVRMIFDEVPSYCEIDGTMQPQRLKEADGSWATCQNSYECESNVCSSGECIEVQSMLKEAGAIKGLAIKVLCRFANLFKEDNYSSCVAKYLNVPLE